MKRKIFDMGKNFKDFKPIDLHEAFVDKSAEVMAEEIDEVIMKFLIDPNPIRELTRDIKKLSGQGLKPQEIADRIDPEKYFGEVAYLYPRKGLL